MDGSLLIKFAADLASMAGLSVANLVGAAAESAFGNLMKKRVDSAREILQGELAAGAKRPMRVSAEEDGAAIVFRYLRAAQEGAARLNLRLLAQIIAGRVSDGPLIADEFLYYAELLAPLRREELVLLGQLIRHADDLTPGEAGRGMALQASKVARVYTSIAKALVPTVFESERHMDAVAASLIRTGLVMAEPVNELQLKKDIYLPSPLAYRLMQLVDIEAAVAGEPAPSTQRPS